jgi:hypothetical protein
MMFLELDIGFGIEFHRNEGDSPLLGLKNPIPVLSDALIGQGFGIC